KRGAELFGRIALRSEEEESVSAYGIHPALLDAALHLRGARGEESGAVVASEWKDVVLHAVGARQAFAWLRAAGGERRWELKITGGRGRPVLTVGDVGFHPVGELDAARESAVRDLYRVEWQEVKLPVVERSAVRPEVVRVVGGDGQLSRGLGAKRSE